MKYNHKKIESKWQRYWQAHPALTAADDKSGAPKQYILDMFPYPSGDGLHTGHVESYTATDILSRYLRMKGFNVLHAQGWDAFGLPAENYAIKTKIHPAETTKKAIANFKKQMNMMGFSYDWSREVNSSDPQYYKWTQWFFLLLYKNGLAYKSKGKVNWCDSCQTVLANEQAEGGVCERCGNPVIQKDLEQWYFKITNFIENLSSEALAKDGRVTSGLLDGLDKIDWPESTKAGQRNWIGKSEGAQFRMSVIPSQKGEESSANAGKGLGQAERSLADARDDKLFLEVFTTRLDTVFGMTFALIAPEHKLVQELKPLIKNWAEVEKYIEETKKKTDLQRIADVKEKTGVELKGVKVINPFTKKAIPLFASDFVLARYGTGAVMAVPGHDKRDFEFAKKYGLPIKPAVFKQEKDSRSFVMGIDEDKLKEIGVSILERTEEGFLKIKIPPEKLAVYKNLVRKDMQPGFWNEFSAEKGFYFIFKHKDGRIEEMELNEETNDLIDGYGATFNNEKIPEKFHNVYSWPSWISEESFYHELLIHTEDGVLVNSGEFNGLTSEQARQKLTQWLVKEKIGQGTINYKMRDWLVSRQRYWGAPIPIIYCPNPDCHSRPASVIPAKAGIQSGVNSSGNPGPGSRVKPGMTEYGITVIDGKEYSMIPVPEKELPVELPTDVDFVPHGESPLAKSKKFQNVKCPKCGESARRESDTMDTFVCSSWYYFRYPSTHSARSGQVAFDPELTRKWMPVDLYVGGAEHVVLHLLYSRFFTKVLHKLGYIDFDEPFLKLRHQGIILSEDGRKMSKSLGNVITPDSVVEQYGADALRMFEMFMGPLEDAKHWNTKGIVGISRFLERVWKLNKSVIPNGAKRSEESPRLGGAADKLRDSSQSLGMTKEGGIEILLHKTIKKVGEDIGSLKFNTAISALMILVNESNGGEFMTEEQYKTFLILIAPFAPFIAEELWANLGNTESIFKSQWPKFNLAMVKDETIQMPVQINGKVRAILTVPVDISEDQAVKLLTSDINIIKWLEGKEPKKMIFVKGRLVNIVV